MCTTAAQDQEFEDKQDFLQGDDFVANIHLFRDLFGVVYTSDSDKAKAYPKEESQEIMKLLDVLSTFFSTIQMTPLI